MELFNGDLTFQEITSRVMSEVHEDSAAIQYHLLDVINFSLPYAKRIELINDWIMLNHWSCDRVMFEIPRVANSAAELMEMFLESERRLQEGLCFRSPDSPYKQGRSTLREEWLIKLCRWKRIECEIIGFEEQVANANAESRNGIGLMDRSTDSANMIGKGTLGALWVQDIYNRKFKVGSGVGMTEKLRQEIWDDTDKWAGKRITIKYKPTGEKNLPRHPVYCGLREKGY
jgi:DNA ligase-1